MLPPARQMLDAVLHCTTDLFCRDCTTFMFAGHFHLHQLCPRECALSLKTYLPLIRTTCDMVSLTNVNGSSHSNWITRLRLCRHPSPVMEALPLYNSADITLLWARRFAILDPMYESWTLTRAMVYSRDLVIGTASLPIIYIPHTD